MLPVHIYMHVYIFLFNFLLYQKLMIYNTIQKIEKHYMTRFKLTTMNTNGNCYINSHIENIKISLPSTPLNVLSLSFYTSLLARVALCN